MWVRRSSLLRDRDFRQFFFSDTTSEFGTQISQLAMPLIAVVALDVSPFQVGLLFTLQFIGSAVLGLPAGVWVDRLRRRSVLIAADIGRAVAFATIPLSWWAGTLSIGHLYVVATMAGVFTVFFDVAHQSYLPQLVGREGLSEGNALLEGVRNVSLVGGPSAAGGIVGLVGAPLAVAVNAVTFLSSAVFVTRIRRREERPVRSERTGLTGDVVAGLRFVFANGPLRAILVGSSLYNLFATMVSVMLIVLLADILELSPFAIGVVFSVAAVGSLAGALVMRRLVERLGYGRTIWLSLAVTAPFGLMLPLAERGWTLWLAAAGYAVVWFGTTIYNISQMTFRQALTPDPMLGRMNASIRFLVGGAMPLGSFLGGALGQAFGVRTAMLIGSIGLMTSFLPTFLSRMRHVHELPDVVAVEPRTRPTTASPMGEGDEHDGS